MLAFLQLFGTFVANLFKSRRRLEVENLFLRHQLNIVGGPRRIRLRGSDRALSTPFSSKVAFALDVKRSTKQACLTRERSY
jgi:hypothetical protein